MTNMKRTTLEVVRGFILSASCVTVTCWLMRNYTANEVKKTRTEKDKEHAEDLRKFEEQRQKEIQMFSSIIEKYHSIIEELTKNKEKVQL